MQPGRPDPVENGPEDGAAFQAVTLPRRRAPVAVAVVAVAVVAIAILSKSAPSVAPTATSQPPASAAVAETASIVPTAVPTVVPVVAPPDRNPNATPYPMLTGFPVNAGITRLLPAGETQARVAIALPGGWQRVSPAMYVKPGDATPVGLSIGVWSIEHVNTFPCRWSSRVFSDELYPSTAPGLADALAGWWGQDPSKPFNSDATIAPIATKPREATIAGYSAWYVEVLIPSVFDLTQCDGDQLVLWQAAGGEARSGLAQSEHNRLWVVDVHGQLIVVDASAPLMPTPTDAAELQAVLDSIAVEP